MPGTLLSDHSRGKIINDDDGDVSWTFDFAACGLRPHDNDDKVNKDDGAVSWTGLVVASCPRARFTKNLKINLGRTYEKLKITLIGLRKMQFLKNDLTFH